MNTVARSGIVVYGCTLLTIPLQFLYKTFLTQNIPLDQAWLLFGSIWAIWLLWMYMDHGRREYLFHHLPSLDGDRKRWLIISGLIAQCCASILLWVVAYLSSDAILGYICRQWCTIDVKPTIIALIIHQVIMWHVWAWESILLALHDAVRQKIIDVWKYAGRSTVVVISILTNHTAISSIAQWFILIPCVLLVVIICRLLIAHHDSVIGGYIFQPINLWYTFGITQLIWIFSMIDIVLVQYIAWSSSTALYTNSILISNGFIFVLSAIWWLLTGSVARAGQQAGQLLSDSMTIMMSLAIFLYGGLWIVLPTVVKILAWWLYDQIYPLVQQTLWRAFIWFMVQIIFAILTGLWLYRQKIIGITWALIAIIISSTINHSLTWVIISLGIGQCIIVLRGIRCISNKIHVSIPYISYRLMICLMISWIIWYMIGWIYWLIMYLTIVSISVYIHYRHLLRFTYLLTWTK